MTIGLSLDLRNDRLQIILDAIDNYGDEYEGGHLLIFGGDRPETGEEYLDEYDNDLLADFSLPWPCGSVSDGVLIFESMADTVGLLTGTASWARIVDALGNFVMDLSVTSTYGGGDVKINSLDIEVGLPIECTSASITEGNA